ncbi:MAG: hypothetical protein HY746_08345 [Elusimicrobia bacterium]|nr:hypothetical protein [Elusimicrobiota bacterium]
MNEEKLKILKMLEEKKITSQEAMELMEALEKTGAGPAREGERRGKFLRIKISDDNSADSKVNINVPIGWAKFLMPFVENKLKQKLEDKGYNVDVGRFRDAIESAEPIKIVDIKNGDEQVDISIE